MSYVAGNVCVFVVLCFGAVLLALGIAYDDTLAIAIGGVDLTLAVIGWTLLDAEYEARKEVANG